MANMRKAVEGLKGIGKNKVAVVAVTAVLAVFIAAGVCNALAEDGGGASPRFARDVATSGESGPGNAFEDDAGPAGAETPDPDGSDGAARITGGGACTVADALVEPSAPSGPLQETVTPYTAEEPSGSLPPSEEPIQESCETKSEPEDVPAEREPLEGDPTAAPEPEAVWIYGYKCGGCEFRSTAVSDMEGHQRDMLLAGADHGAYGTFQWLA